MGGDYTRHSEKVYQIATTNRAKNAVKVVLQETR